MHLGKLLCDIKNWYFNVGRKKFWKLPRDHIDFDLNHRITFVSFSKKHLYQKNHTWGYWFFGFICFRPTQNTGGQENRNYELRVSFCISLICWKKTNYWGFSYIMSSNFDNILIIVVKSKYFSFYLFCPTLKSFCCYYKIGVHFIKYKLSPQKE